MTNLNDLSLKKSDEHKEEDEILLTRAYRKEWGRKTEVFCVEDNNLNYLVVNKVYGCMNTNVGEKIEMKDGLMKGRDVTTFKILDLIK